MLRRACASAQTIQSIRFSHTKMMEVRKKATIRNRYNQVPNLTQGTIWESDKTQENITHKKSKRSADDKAARNRQDSTKRHMKRKKQKGSTKEAPPWNGQ